jgi:hypothetical protein
LQCGLKPASGRFALSTFSSQPPSFSRRFAPELMQPMRFSENLRARGDKFAKNFIVKKQTLFRGIKTYPRG